jgi:hypothetical protein
MNLQYHQRISSNKLKSTIDSNPCNAGQLMTVCVTVTKGEI